MFVLKKSISSALILSTFLSTTSAFAMNPGDDDQKPKVSAVAPKSAPKSAPQASEESGWSTGAIVGTAVAGVGLAALWWFSDPAPKRSVAANDMSSPEADQQFVSRVGTGLKVASVAVAATTACVLVNRETGEENPKGLPLLAGGAAAVTIAAPFIVDAMNDKGIQPNPSPFLLGSVVNAMASGAHTAEVVTKAALGVTAAGVVGAGAFALAAGTEGIVDGSITGDGIRQALDNNPAVASVASAPSLEVLGSDDAAALEAVKDSYVINDNYSPSDEESNR